MGLGSDRRSLSRWLHQHGGRRASAPFSCRKGPWIVHERPVSVAVEQPVAEVVVEPVAEVVFEAAPPEVVATYETDLTPLGHWATVINGSYEAAAGHGMGATRAGGPTRSATGPRPTPAGSGWPRATNWNLGPPAITSAAGMKTPPKGGSGCRVRIQRRPGARGAKGTAIPPGRRFRPNAATTHHQCRRGRRTLLPARSRFVCVETRNITNVNIHTIIVRDVTIIQKTTNITKITYVNNRAVNRGVDVKIVEKATGHPVHALKKPSRFQPPPKPIVSRAAAGHAVVQHADGSRKLSQGTSDRDQRRCTKKSDSHAGPVCT